MWNLDTKPQYGTKETWQNPSCHLFGTPWNTNWACIFGGRPFQLGFIKTDVAFALAPLKFRHESGQALAGPPGPSLFKVRGRWKLGAAEVFLAVAKVREPWTLTVTLTDGVIHV